MISLDQFITNETGKKHLIPGQSEEYRGQCVQLIGVYLLEVYGQTLPIHPNAKDYWTYGIPGWDKTTTPLRGDIAIYDGHLGFPEGHIAIYYDSQVFEENADPDGSPAHLFARANTNLLGYLHKGEPMPEDYKMNRGDAENMFEAILGRPATPADLDYYGGPEGQENKGRIWKDAMYDLTNSDEYKKRIENTGQVNRQSVLDYTNKNLQ